MQTLFKRCVLGTVCLIATLTTMPVLAEGPVKVVAAESSYGSMVKTIGGDHVDVISLLDSPSVNPHEFKGTPKIGRQLQEADLVVMNGVGYDSWMRPLLNGTSSRKRQVVIAGKAASNMVLPDKNPHLFYDPRIMLVTASQVARKLTRVDPEHHETYAKGLERFRKKLIPIYSRMQKLISQYPNLTVASTEPVYGYMLHLLGYKDIDKELQFATQNGSEPSARQVKEFIQQLKTHKVDLFIFNDEVSTNLTKSLLKTAREAGLPAISVGELPLHGEDYAHWQITSLQNIEEALAAVKPGP